MATQRITVRIPTKLAKELKKQAGLRGRPESELVRKALADYLASRTPVRSAYDIAKEAGLIGCVKDTPRDLSTNRKYFDGFGKNR